MFGYSHDFAAQSEKMPAPNLVDSRDLTRDLGLQDETFMAEWGMKASIAGLMNYDSRRYAELLEMAEKLGMDTMMWSRYHQAQSITN